MMLPAADWRLETTSAMVRVMSRLYPEVKEPASAITAFEYAAFCEIDPLVAAVLILTARANANTYNRLKDLAVTAANAGGRAR